MRFLDQIKLKIFIKIYINLYQRISFLSTKLNKGNHPKHEIIKYYQFFKDNIDKNSKILDIGCGHGYLAYKIADKAQKVVAIDIDKNLIRLAKERHNRKNIKYIIGDATTYEFEEKFKYIILSNVLEHIKNRKDFLKRLKPLAKYFLIRVPMINRSWLPLYIKKLGYEYRLDPYHYIEYTFKSFKNEIESAGMKILSHSIQFGEIWARIITET